MAVTLDEVIKLAKQLSRPEQMELLKQLQPSETEADQEKEFLGLLVFDVGPWPDDLALRREEMYN